MSIFSQIFEKKKKSKYVFTDEDRRISEKRRKLNAELRQVEQEIVIAQQRLELEKAKAELEEVRDRLRRDYEDTEEPYSNQSFDSLFQGLLLKAFLGNQNSQSQQAQEQININSEEPKVKLSDEELVKIIEQVPKNVKKQCKKMDVDTLKSLIKGHIGFSKFDDDTINRGIVLLQS